VARIQMDVKVSVVANDMHATKGLRKKLYEQRQHEIVVYCSLA